MTAVNSETDKATLVINPSNGDLIEGPNIITIMETCVYKDAKWRSYTATYSYELRYKLEDYQMWCQDDSKLEISVTNPEDKFKMFDIWKLTGK